MNNFDKTYKHAISQINELGGAFNESIKALDESHFPYTKNGIAIIKRDKFIKSYNLVLHSTIMSLVIYSTLIADLIEGNNKSSVKGQYNRPFTESEKSFIKDISDYCKTVKSVKHCIDGIGTAIRDTGSFSLNTIMYYRDDIQLYSEPLSRKSIHEAFFHVKPGELNEEESGGTYNPKYYPCLYENHIMLSVFHLVFSSMNFDNGIKEIFHLGHMDNFIKWFNKGVDEARLWI